MLPSQVSSSYSFPAGRSLENECIAIIELGGSLDQLSLKEFCVKNGYLEPQLVIDTVDGAVPILTGFEGADGEVCLDAQVIAGVAQGVKLLVIFCPNTNQGFVDGIMAAANHSLNPCCLSISWGGPLSEYGTDADIQAMNNAIQYCVSKGIQVFVASGDSGALDGTESPTTDFPAASPYAIACGGTKLVLNSDGTIQSQSAWSWDGANPPGSNGASGGGVASQFPTPAFQDQVAKQLGLQGRLVPDVAGVADPTTGYDIIVDQVPMTVGGTSGVAPLYAALCAIITSRLGQRVSNWQEILYSQSVTVSVSGGDNETYQATPGYNLVCGLGYVDGEKLLIALAQSNKLQVLPAMAAKSNPTIPVSVPQANKLSMLIQWFKGLFGKKTNLRKHIKRN